MKPTYFAALAISSFLTIGTVATIGMPQSVQANPCAAAAVDPCAAVNPCAAVDPCAAVNPCAAVDPCAAANPCAAVNPCAASAPIATSTFQNSAKSTSGSISIVEENGTRYLELADTFRSDNGPDLFVLLHKEASPQNYSPEQFVNLGTLQSTTGAQRYEIPSDVSIEDFASIAIWCRQFNVTFGTALL